MFMTIDASQASSSLNECELIIQSSNNLDSVAIPITLQINPDNFILGDMNLDNDLNILDVLTMLQLILNESADPETLLIGDIFSLITHTHKKREYHDIIKNYSGEVGDVGTESIQVELQTLCDKYNYDEI